MPRLDVYLYEKQYFKSRQKSREAIVDGCVSVGGSIVTKPGTVVSEGVDIAVSNKCNRFVGRGGLKLEFALMSFGVDVRGKIAIDVGASTGGFTDCLLRYGIKKVYAIDVGHGQMDEDLAANSKVALTEGLNARGLMPGEINGGNIDIAVIDVSFISLKSVLLPVAAQLKEGADIICLVKPQFEVGPGSVGKNGIVKSAKARMAAVEEIKAFASENSLIPVAEAESPISGASGNVEYLLHLKKADSDM